MRKRRIFSWFLIILLIVLIGFGIWLSGASKPMDVALKSLESTQNVQVKIGKWIEFIPNNPKSSTGFIFYPGGKVEPEAYAPLAQEIAQNGYTVLIVPMPVNLAIFGANRASKVIDTHTELDSWVIGGHSLGGAMAARYVYKNPTRIQGLVFLASYPANSNNLSEYQGEVLSLYGSRDGLATVEKVMNTQKLLPMNTNYVEITGGNHSQFGWYGFQSGDNKAEITREEQQKIISAEILKLLDTVSANASVNTQLRR